MVEKEFVCKHCGKKFDKKQKLGGHIIWCKKNPQRSGVSNLKDYLIKGNPQNFEIFNKECDDLFCVYCGKQCKSLNSLKNHEKRCKCNPNRIYTKNSGLAKYNELIKNNERKPWNKGLTKEDHPSIKKSSETYLKHIKEGLVQPGGGYRECAVKYHYKYGKYKGFYCDSSWELAFLVYCLENNINIKRNTQKFEYVVDGKKHNFIPDFILNENEYIEIKGLQDENWKIKSTTFKNVKFLFRKDMQKYLSYAKQKYGKNFWEVLYEK